MEREKGRERITPSCEYERESCPKVVKKWLSKYHFSIKKEFQGLKTYLNLYTQNCSYVYIINKV
jgi:hypothetical protein